MKKVISVVLVLALLSVCVVALTACSPAGDYKFDSCKGKLAGFTVEDVAGEDNVTKDAVTLTINKDGTYSFTSNLALVKVSQSGKWEKKGNTITFDDQYTATVKGKTLTLSSGDEDSSNYLVFTLTR